MKPRTTVSRAVAAILSAHAAHAVYAAEPASGTPAESAGGLQEVIVTANRRTENLQNVPITIQALTGETLTQLNATTFDDYVKFLPNVTAATNGPGQGQIYMRGLATTEDGLQSSGATGSFPNVAVYLDEQSAQLPGRNLDIYAADIERIEVLEGPQGTLFGAGAQAGVIRYITNKPKINVTEANFNAGYATTVHGKDSTNFDGMLNLPLIEDKLAVRGVLYNDSRGGYIDNVAGSFTRNPTDVGIAAIQSGLPGRQRPDCRFSGRGAQEPDHQQRQHRRPVNQPGRLQGRAPLSAVRHYRAVERSGLAIVSGHQGRWRVCGDAIRPQRRDAAGPVGGAIQSVHER